VARLARLHFRQEGDAAVVHPAHIDRHDAVEGFGRDRLERLERKRDAGIVAQDIDLAELRGDRLLHFGPAFQRSDVVAQGDDALPNALCFGFRIVEIDVGYRNAGSALGERLGDPGADAATAAGDEHNLA
jgi:hypothetical protein